MWQVMGEKRQTCSEHRAPGAEEAYEWLAQSGRARILIGYEHTQRQLTQNDMEEL